jgi:hypothetical protein
MQEDNNRRRSTRQRTTRITLDPNEINNDGSSQGSDNEEYDQEADEEFIAEEYEQDRETAEQLLQEILPPDAIPPRRVWVKNNCNRNWFYWTLYTLFMTFYAIPKYVPLAAFQLFDLAISRLLVDPFIDLFFARRPDSEFWIRADENRRRIGSWCTWSLITLSTILAIYSYAKNSNGDLTSHMQPAIPPKYIQGLSEGLKKLEDQMEDIWLQSGNQDSQLGLIQQSIDFIYDTQENQWNLLSSVVDLSTEQVSTIILQILQDASFWKKLFRQFEGFYYNTTIKTTTAAATTASSTTSSRTTGGQQTTVRYNTLFETDAAHLGDDGVNEKEYLMKLLSRVINDIVHKNMVESINSALNKYHEDLLRLLPILINDIVNSKISKYYHQDVLNTADFALGYRGARIIYSLTSDTYHPLPAWLQSLRYFAGLPDDIYYHGPEMALTPQAHAGECWYMYDQEGTLGIRLSKPIIVKAVTVEYPSPNVMLDEMQSAPKEMELFGIPNYPSSTEEQVSLVKFQYDINTSSSIQTFDMPVNIDGSGSSDRGQVFQAVLLKIHSNWGNKERTDIYRVRIHGVPA